MQADSNALKRVSACHGRLLELDPADIRTPVEEVRSWLLAKYEGRNDLHPAKLEQVVASVFRDLGYEAQATAYQRDGGIDVVLVGKAGEKVGVQVKRYRQSIKIEQIHAFTGALLFGKFEKDIYVTTSGFQSGAVETAKRANDIVGVPIELINAKQADLLPYRAAACCLTIFDLTVGC